MEHVVQEVDENSIAAALGIEKGDVLVSINGHEIRDALDYKTFLAGENICLLMKKKTGNFYEYDIEKEAGEDLGLEFNNPIMDRLHVCCNKCIFCFIDQLPRGMRKKLYFKDDDYRMSLLFGSYITLTNLSQQELKRITTEKISPLYISVHTTDPALRVKMLGNPRGGELMTLLKELKAGGIYFHSQIVLCPKINDGRELDKTVGDLSSLLPNLLSIAAVPVGITTHREGLYPLKGYTAAASKEVIEQCHYWQKEFRKKTGKNIVYLADEFYLAAGWKIPARREYDDFPQLENGVGLVRLLLDDFAKQKKRLPGQAFKPGLKSIACGVSMAKVLARITEAVNQTKDLTVNLYPVVNS
ncbi:MAG TPA: DUF512 domain-containing protein, partial [Firmicutes bacterium]|nr:DUF512 domain-containing protein [Bacillota bacterium]